MTVSPMEGLDWAVTEGLLSALVICVLGFGLSQVASRFANRLPARKQSQRYREPYRRLVGWYVGMFVRMLVSVLGIIAVYGFGGESWVVPCALGIMPLYLIEVICSVSVQLYRIKRREQITKSESTHERWN